MAIGTDDSDIALFSYSGNIMIGRIYKKGSIDGLFYTNGSIIGTLIGNSEAALDNYYAIENPCQIDFVVQKTATGSASIKWNLKPFFYKKLVKSSAGAIHFAFPKTEVCLSNIASNDIDDKLLSAYKELVQIR